MPAFISSPKVTSLHSALAQSFITTTSSPFLFLLHLKWFRSQLPSVPTRRTPVNRTCPDHATLGSAPVKRHYLGKLEASLSPVSLIGPCALAIQTRRHRIRTSSTQLFRVCCPGRTRIALSNPLHCRSPIHCLDNCDRCCSNVYPLSIPHFADCERSAGS